MKKNCYHDNCFQLPIEFLNNKQKLSDNLINDLELTETIHEDTKPVYILYLIHLLKLVRNLLKVGPNITLLIKFFKRFSKNFIKMLMLYHLIK